MRSHSRRPDGWINKRIPATEHSAAARATQSASAFGATQRVMKFALSKKWLPERLQSQIWLLAHDAPHARVMRDVTVICRPSQRGLPIKQLRLKSGVHHRTAYGRSCVNPCYQCEMADMTGVSEFCGRCRNRLTVRTTNITDDPFLGLTVQMCQDLTPRAEYMPRRRFGVGSDDDDDA